MYFWFIRYKRRLVKNYYVNCVDVEDDEDLIEDVNEIESVSEDDMWFNNGYFFIIVF